MRLASLPLLLLAAGCFIDGTADGPDDDSDRPPAARTAPILSVRQGCLEEERLFVRSAAVVDTYAMIVVEHSGGCGDHTYQVCWDGLFAVTDPPEVDLKVHDRTDDTCDALVHQPLVVDLAALRPGDDGQALELVFSEAARVLYP